MEPRGERKGRLWHLSAAAYRRLGQKKAAYIRQRGFEPLQQEQMVLQYVEQHGRITRREAAELCQISPLQARDLLARLVKGSKLVRHGTRRGAFYGLESIDMDESKPDTDTSITKSTASKPRRGT